MRTKTKLEDNGEASKPDCHATAPKAACLSHGNVKDWRFSVVAIPLFGHEVAPRFCFALEALAIRFDSGEEVSRRTLPISGLPWFERLRLLAKQDVGLLLCSGFNRRLLPIAEGLGITVVWGLVGDVEAVLDQLERGQLPERCAIGDPRRVRRLGNGRGYWRDSKERVVQPNEEDMVVTGTDRRTRK